MSGLKLLMSHQGAPIKRPSNYQPFADNQQLPDSLFAWKHVQELCLNIPGHAFWPPTEEHFRAEVFRWTHDIKHEHELETIHIHHCYEYQTLCAQLSDTEWYSAVPMEDNYYLPSLYKQEGAGFHIHRDENEEWMGEGPGDNDIWRWASQRNDTLQWISEIDYPGYYSDSDVDSDMD